MSKPKTGGRPQGPGKPKPLYQIRRKSSERESATRRTPPGSKTLGDSPSRVLAADLPHATPIAPAHFTLRDDGSIGARSSSSASGQPDAIPSSEAGASRSSLSTPPRLLYQADTPFVRLYHGNSLELLDAIATKYPEGRFDCIFADPQLR